MTRNETGPLDDVAVLMPVYNCQEDAWRTLASLRETAPLRVLVVDDGSEPPFAAPPARDLPGLRIEVLRLTPNGGIEAALAAGVEHLHAQGVEFVARIDGGDLARPGRIAAQRAAFVTAPRLGALGTWAQAVSRDGRPRFVMAPPTEAAAIRRVRFARSCFIHPAMMLRMRAVRAAGSYRDRYPAAEDLDLFLRIMREWDCANLPLIGIDYELNESGISASRRRRQILSTLRLQCVYFEPGNPLYWVGFAKHLLHLLTPYAVLSNVKRMLRPRESASRPIRR
ncbi:glycosyltransferase [Chitinasiproducens palmae]|uniref:Glycosyltransferase, GT2 family n=1 Tax=Chitinasiproducens palmae TaxID=1770053 RepID=A0A1H2PML8_9BURK|nr:glycosyltransferase [Chitinasiproducens palmae]SDV47811.1 Glycosyltransferase, GT2 family [Chitinasiproducens palmae]